MQIQHYSSNDFKFNKENSSMINNYLVKPVMTNSIPLISFCSNNRVLNNNLFSYGSVKPVIITKRQSNKDITNTEQYIFHYILSNNPCFQIINNNIEHRFDIINWVSQMAPYFRFTDYSFFKSIELIDRYLENRQDDQKQNIALVRTTIFYMTSKLQQVQQLKMYMVVDKVGNRKHSKKQIVAMQAKIMHSLGFNLMTTTIYDICMLLLHKHTSKFNKISDNIELIQEFVSFICKISLFYPYFFQFPRYMLAMSILCLSLDCANCGSKQIKNKIIQLSYRNDPIEGLTKDLARGVIQFQRQFQQIAPDRIKQKQKYVRIKSAIYLLGY